MPGSLVGVVVAVTLDWRHTVRAQDLAAPFPTVGMETSAMDAARLLAGQNLPDATVLEIAVVMARSRSPLVAVAAKKQPLLGAITLDAWLDRIHGE